MALEIQIGADSSDLNKKIKEAELALKELSQVKLERIKLGLDTKEINGNIASVKKSLNELKTVSKDTGTAIGGMAPKVASGGNALMQFSRIAQDAPYGIIGIGNNITATVEAFGYLKNETGSTGGALKALAGSIMGSGGILLAVSLVTTAFTYMSQNGLTVGDVIDKMTGSFDANRKAMQDMNAEVAKNSQAQISSVGAYASAAKNINLSMSDRLIAVKKLQDEYPAYFGNLSKEQILNGDVAGAVRGVTNALVAKAKATGLSGMISDNAKVMYQLDSQVDNINKQKQAWMDMFKNVEKGSGDEVRMLLGIRSFNLRINDAITEKNKLNRDNLNLTKEINKETAKSIKLESPSIKAPKAPKQEKTPKPKKYKNPNPNFNSGNGFIGGGIVNPNLGLITPDLGVDEAAIAANEKLRLALELQKKTIEDFNKELGSIVTNGTVNALAGIGESIGSALASGGNVIDAVGKSILGSMGSMLQELGKATIAYGVGLIAIKTAIKNPATAIAAGAAMVALGSMISKSVAKSSSVVGGGGSVSTGASVSSPTSSTGSGGSSSFTGGTVVFEISGQSLIGVLSNTLDKNRRLGGSLSLG